SLVLALFSRSTLALADAPTSDGASAQVFFERGRQAAARGDAAEACKNFEESLRLDLAVGTLFNLARCEQDLGRLANAWQHLREGIDRLEEKDPRRKPALAAANEFEPRVPRLAVKLAPGASGQVLRDGVELASLSLGSPLPVNPGHHVIVVRAVNHADASYEVDLREGEQRTLVVAPGLSASPKEPKPRSSPLRTTGWATAGVGAGALAVGLVTGAIALERSFVVHDHCSDVNLCDDTGMNALATSKQFGGIATVTTIAGAALIATGVVLVILGKTPPTTTGALRSTVLRF
ncbi:MAG TPA: hypothetical protein VM925_27240, partial [Labilithrix sp.]|nr:hypothetical protein [Labilithrix sp.]